MPGEVLERTRDEWMEIFLANDVAAEPFMTTEEGLSHPQALHQGDVIELLDPRVGRTRQVGPIGQLAGTPVGPRGPAPDVDQNTDDFASVIEGPRGRPGGGSGPAPAHPLSGVTVLEFAGYIAAPFATSLLADMGARVIKVEPVAGDGYRAMGVPEGCQDSSGEGVHRPGPERATGAGGHPEARQARRRVPAPLPAWGASTSGYRLRNDQLDQPRDRICVRRGLWFDRPLLFQGGVSPHRGGYHRRSDASGGKPAPAPEQAMTPDEIL